MEEKIGVLAAKLVQGYEKVWIVLGLFICQGRKIKERILNSKSADI